MLKKSLIAVFTAILLAGCSKPYETTGLIMQESESIESVEMQQLRELAKTDPAAAYDMGLRYLRGDGVSQDSYRGLDALRAAATKGDTQAQAALGKIYLSGMEEMGADLPEAKKWLSMAAEKGDAESSKLLSKLEKNKKKKKGSKKRPCYGYRYDWYYHNPYRLHWDEDTWKYW